MFKTLAIDIKCDISTDLYFGLSSNGALTFIWASGYAVPLRIYQLVLDVRRCKRDDAVGVWAVFCNPSCLSSCKTQKFL